MALPSNASKGLMTPTPKGTALRKLVRGPDGNIRVVFVDARTGKEVGNPEDYNIVTAGDLPNATSQTTEAPKEEKKEEDKSLTKEMVLPSGSDNDSSNAIKAAGATRGANQNYGYINKPGFMNFAGALPGPLGFFGKMANTAMNINNAVATNEAREMLGMPTNPLKDAAKVALAHTGIGSKLVDTKSGYIGDLSVPGETQSVPVGFEASDKFGRTTLTPNEARMRQQLAGATVTPAEQVKASVARFKKENPQAEEKGLVRNLFSGAKSLFSDLFGAEDEQSSARLDTNSFPDRPSPMSESEKNNLKSTLQDGWGGSSSDPTSESQQARNAVNSGTGGLW